MIKDLQIFELIEAENQRQREGLELIASENFTSQQVMDAMGSVFTNKYAEGYPGRRYYGGCEVVDEMENVALERVKALFGAEYANVQPHSGAQANAAVFLALLKPGAKIMGFDLSHGGHLTHGSPVNFSGKYFQPSFYGVEESTGLLNYDEIQKRAEHERPDLIICGASAYSRDIDYVRFRAIADSVGALLMADISHPSGLIAKGVLNDPLPHCHVVTTTTHKTLRGPRGGLIMMGQDFENPFGLKTPKGKVKSMSALLDGAVFPGTQGGPLEHVIAAKAVAFGEALRPEFRAYQEQVVKNAQALADQLMKGGLDIVSGGTDSHLMLVDLLPKGVKGNATEVALGRAHITCNKNGIPFDDEKPMITSGIRLGSPAGTTRGFGETEFRQIADWIVEVVDGLAANGADANAAVEAKVRGEVKELCGRFPMYPGW